MIAWAIETLIATTLLMLLVLALRAPVRHAFGPQIAYALWILPVARLLLPPLPGSWQWSAVLAPMMREAEAAPAVAVGVMNPAALSAEVAARATTVDFGTAAQPMPIALVPPTPVVDGPGLLVLLAGFWALGALGFLAWHLIAHRRHCAALLRRARVDRAVAEGRVRVIETDAAHGPLAFGVFRKYVAFPRDFAERYDEQERDLALAHELGHHVRGDLLANWVALFVLALHWFNPIAWRAFRAFRADQEMACDALVLAGRAQALRHAYGRAIVKSAHGGAVSAACHLHTINEVKGRLRMLSKTRSYTPRRMVAGLAGVAAIGLVGLGLTASGTQAAERITTRVEETVRTTLSQATPPAPPAVPAAPGAPAVPAAPAVPEAPAVAEAPQVPEAPALPGGLAAPAVPQPPKLKPGTYRTTIITQDKDKEGEQARRFFMLGGRNIEITIPDVRAGTCGAGSPAVEHRMEGDRKITILCQDRIGRISDDAVRVAFLQKRAGLDAARAGLRGARASIAAQAALSDAQKQAALAGIDQALAEIEAEGAQD